MNDDELMDQLLRKAMSADQPTLSVDFDARVVRQLRPKRLTQGRQAVLALYLIVAVATTVWLMWDLPTGAIVAGLVASAAVAVASGAYGRHLARSR
jgi:hypothetical protein